MGSLGTCAQTPVECPRVFWEGEGVATLGSLPGASVSSALVSALVTQRQWPLLWFFQAP